MHVRFSASCLIGAIVIACALFSAPAFAASSSSLTPQRALDGAGFDVEPSNRPVTYPRTVAWWPFATGPHYGHAAGLATRDSDVLSLPVGSFRIGNGLQIPAELTASLQGIATGKAQHFVVQLRPSAFELPFRDLIESLGAEIVGSLPVHGLMLRMDQAAYDRIASSPLVQFVEPFHPAYKIAPSVGRVSQASPEDAASPLFRLELTLFRGEPIQPTLEALARLGAQVEHADGSGSFGSVWVTGHAALIPQLAQLESVRLINERAPQMLHNFGAVWHQSTVSNTALHYWRAGLDGDGQIIAITDSGASVDAGDLSHTRADSGYSGGAEPTEPTTTNQCLDLDGPEDGNGINQNHRKIACYTRANLYGGSGDYSACDASPAFSGLATHGQLSASVAAGNATRGVVPAGGAPSPTDDPDSTYCVPFTDAVLFGGTCATAISYGAGFFVDDASGTAGVFSEIDTAYDGVAKGARVVIVDAEPTCPENDFISPGSQSSRMNGLFLTFGANIQNESFGSSPTPGLDPTYPTAIDAAIWDHAEIFLSQSAGNDGDTGNEGCAESLGNIGNEASCKNCMAVGAANGVGESGFTSVGPALSNAGSGGINDGQSRIAPRIFAQGVGEAACLSQDASENQSGAATCGAQSASGTSFSAPNVAGLAAIVGEYIEGGFYPDGTDGNTLNNAEKVPNFSSALTQAILIAGTLPVPIAGDNAAGRGNNLGGWGQVYLNLVLPLSGDPDTVSGLILHSLEDLDRTDGSTATTGINGLSGIGDVITGTTTVTQEFEVLNDVEDLAVAMVWYEPETGGAALTNDLDLVLRNCNGDACGNANDIVFQGNAFHEDNDQNCGDHLTPANWDLNGDGSLDGYSYTISDNAIVNAGFVAANYSDNANNVEAIFVPSDGNQPGLNDVDGDADGSGDWPLVTTGTWRIDVTCTGCTDNISPAIAIAGPVAAGSGVRFDKNPVTCNDEVITIVSEIAGDAGCGGGLCSDVQVGALTSIAVLDETGTPTGDSESLAGLFGPAGTGLRFETSALPLSSVVPASSGDGILSVQNGYTLLATYQDEPGDDRTATTTVDCQPDIEVAISGQIGLDQQFLLIGGCDEDSYFDQDETFSISVNFFNLDTLDLFDATVSMLECLPGSFNETTGTCTAANALVIHNNDTTLSTLPSFTTQLTRFAVSTIGTPAGRTEVDLAFCLSAEKQGQNVKDCSVTRVLLQADDEEQLYITDCPTGCTVDYDRNFDEVYDNFIPTNAFDPLDFVRAGLDETGIVYGNMQSVAGSCEAGSTCGNPGFVGAWNWDGVSTDDEGFRSGISELSVDVNVATPNSNWGEDENFNGTFDSGEDKSDGATTNGLDQNFGQGGGCGYMTASGCWHTGTIGSGGTPGTNCRGNDSICEQYDKEDGTDGVEYWFEMLRTPEIHPVNFGADTGDGFDWRSQITAWEWNMQMSTGEDEGYLWEIDVNVDSADDVILGDDLFSVLILNDVFFGFGLGAIEGGQLNIIEGAPLFADTCDVPGADCNGGAAGGTYGDEYNGQIAPNRAGLRGCYFEDLNLLTVGGSDPDNDGSIEFTHAEFITNTARPLDDDCDNEADPGADGCPGQCGVDDDGDGVVDNLNELCPCFTCDFGPRAGIGCADHPFCNPAGDVTTGDNRCVNDVDTYTANPSQNNTSSDKLPGSAGTPRAYFDDQCGDGLPDENVFASFDTSANQRQTRNYGTNIGNLGRIENDTMEDLFGPAGDTWQGEIGFVSFEPSGTVGDPSYGLAVDDMVMEWRELHPIDQTTNTCNTQVLTNGPGQCASIGMGATANTFEGDGAIPVTVIDPDTTDNLGEAPCAGNQIRIEAYSEAERTPTSYCLTDDGTGKAFSGFIKTTTQIKNSADDLVFLAFNFADTPSVTARYFDKNDGVNAYSVGADAQPGIAGFDDDNDGATDEADELCPVDNVLGPGRSPHLAGQPARHSDDVCGCPDNPLTDVTLATFNAVDLLVTKVLVTDDGDGDGWADGDEEVTIDIEIRNLSNADLENVRLKLTSDSAAVGCLTDDEVFIATLAGNDDAPGGLDEAATRVLGDSFSFIASNAVSRGSIGEDLTSTFNLSLQATAPADPTLGINEDLEIQGLFTIREIEVVHNLNSSGAPASAADFTEDFEGIKCTSDAFACQGGGDTFLLCNNTGPNGACTGTGQSFHAFVTGDDTAELDGTRCQFNDPANPFGANTDPNDACELGEGFDTTEQHVHLHGTNNDACEGNPCHDGGRSHNAGGSQSLHIGWHPTSSECPTCAADDWWSGDETTLHLNRMRWAELANNVQLGLGADHPSFTEDPGLIYWTQISITDGGLFGAARGAFAWDAHRVYVCEDNNDNDFCDTPEFQADGTGGDGSETWEAISASLNPESNARVAGFINCGYDPSDDGSNEDDLFANELIFGPSSTCFGTQSDTCVGRTKSDYTGIFAGQVGPQVTLSSICFNETGVIDDILPGVYEADGPGQGIWAKREYDLGKYKGHKVLFRWHISPTGLEGIDFTGAVLGGSGGSRDDGVYVDDIQVDGVSADFGLAADNTNPGANTCVAGNECGSVTTRVAILPFPRSDANDDPRPALACTELTLGSCDFNDDSVVDAAGSTASLNAAGRPAVILANASTADTCLGGALEFRFEESGGALIRDWLTRSDLLVNPSVDTTYRVKVRCSSDPTCTSEQLVTIDVPDVATSCRTVNLLFNQGNKTTFSWGAPAGAGCPTTYDAARGNVSTLGSLAGATCLEEDGIDLLATDVGTPATGAAFWYLTRAGADSYNNETGPAQVGDRDTTLTACSP